MAIPIMQSMFPAIVRAVNIHLNLLPPQRNMSFAVPTHQHDFQACHDCLSVIMLYNPPLHTRARFASSCNTLASSSNPLVASRSLHSVVASSKYFIIELLYCKRGVYEYLSKALYVYIHCARTKGKKGKEKAFSLLFVNHLSMI